LKERYDEPLSDFAFNLRRYIKVYEFVCRHFLACCSLPAIAFKTQAGLKP
jgi:DNA topoisomerase IA